MIKAMLIKIRSILTFWVWGPDIDYLKNLRETELVHCIHLLDPGCRLLDFGAGAGHQAAYFAEKDFKVSAIDLAESNYIKQKIFTVEIYDGKKIPFENCCFDAIFASNVFEHIQDTQSTLSEIARVAEDDGILILLMPSSSWRIWTILTDVIRSWKITKPHGEHSANVFHEILTFRAAWWQQRLQHPAWKIELVGSNDLFYTGNNIFGPRLPFHLRKKMATILGGSCNLFVLRKQ